MGRWIVLTRDSDGVDCESWSIVNHFGKVIE